MGGPAVTHESRWKSAFLTLPDAAFFDILRNYLGEFKTPYNKHSLLENLRRFLLRAETRERIVSLVDEPDAQLLTAVEILDAPGHEQLYRLFEGEMSYLALHHRLLNLQDRLLVYTDKSSGAERIFLTPFLEDDLRARVIDPGLLLSREICPGLTAPAPWPGDALLSAFFSCVLEDGDMLRAGGTLKKKAETVLRKKIPVLFERGPTPCGSREESGPAEASPSRAILLLRALQTLKLLRLKEKIEPDPGAWREFAAMEPFFRLCMIVCAATEKDFLHTWEEAEWLAAFLSYPEKGTAYTPRSLLRLRRLLRDSGGSGGEKAWLDNLLDFGLFVPVKTGGLAINPLLPAELPPDKTGKQKRPPRDPHLIVQPNFDVSARPHLPLAEGIVLAAAARLVRCDVYAQYELSKTSFARALGLGLEAKTILDSLAGLCGESLPQNVVFSIGAWEKEYASISLTEGIVLQMEEDRRHLLEHHKGFSRLVRLKPALGVYVIARSDLAACLTILAGAGVEISPRLRRAEELPPGEPSFPAPPFDEAPAGLVFPRAFRPAALSFPLVKRGGPRPGEETGQPSKTGSRRRLSRSALQEELLAHLAKAKLPEDRRGEIRERIKNRLIIFPEQIRLELARSEKTEANGLDYVGKTLVIEQALANRSDYLETLVRENDGSPARVLLRPGALRKSGSGLILEGVSLPGGETLEIPVKKISLVRRIRGSLSG
jgi:hypothetical protein